VTLVPRLAHAIDQIRPGARVMVAIDGPDAAGKTTLADAVARQMTRPTLRVSLDDWHHPRDVRLRRGPESPLGYYRDSFDEEALTARLLDPFRAGASTVQSACFDFRLDAPAAAQAEVRSPAAVLLLDGVFLLRPELRHHWDLSVYLHVPESVTLARAVVRDAEHRGGAEQVRRRYEQRYLPGQALYRDAASPLDEADVVIDNSDPLRPTVVRWLDLG
jgi:uridine kinase